MTDLSEPASQLDAADAFAELARARLLQTPPSGDDDLDAPPDRGDHDLNPDLEPGYMATRRRRAAVLVPIVSRAQPSVLLTRRADHLPSHAGQIAFPGGKVEKGDDGPLQAALRETREEIGLDRNEVTPLGYLDLYETSTGFRIVPVVGLVRPGFDLLIDRNEVAAVFEVPLSFLMSPANHQRHSRNWQGKRRSFYAMPYGEHYIWGATAGMLRALYDRLYR
ncbi:MAG: CoA pyrophosphatase [Pseudomonadota bacterium]